MPRPPTTLLLATCLALGACAAPRTQLGTISPEQIILEQARQQEFALATRLKQTFRLHNVANPLLVAAGPLCAEKVQPVSGFIAGNAYQWKNDYFKAAERLGYTDTLIIMNITPGLPGDDAGLKVGDRILAVNGMPIVTGPRALNDLESKLPGAKVKAAATYTLTYRRGSEIASVRIPTQMACAYNPQLVESDDINAWADGRSIFVTTGISRFAADDDELAVVVGHELAHDAMRHIDAMNKNSMIGALLGAVVDVAAATQGVNTQGDFTKQGARLGSMVFSQDFEREADYVGLYILALDGRPIEDAPMFWRRMAAAHPGSIKFARSHPTTAERFVRLDNWRREIDRKVALGLPLAPELKSGNTALANSFGTAPTRTARNPKGDRSSANTVATTQERPPGTQQALTETAERSKPKPISRMNESADATPSVRSSITSEASAREGAPSMVAARAVIGAPSSDLDRTLAIESFAEANGFMGSHQWNKAEESFRKTVLLDGSVAKYHAGLGSVLMLLGKWKDAEAEYTAAMMLDLDNPVYRRMVKEARAKR
jgi:beta-barrel assembly-enhancing protease